MASKDERVYSQIEASADYYEPSIYSALGFTSLFQALDDPAKGDFIPLLSPSAYKLGEANATGHMFVVGLLPPTSNVTARPIDRSATVANLQGGVGAADLGGAEPDSSGGGAGYWQGSSIVTAPGYKIAKGTGTSNIGVPPTSVSPCPQGTVIIDASTNPRTVRHDCMAHNSMRQVYQAMHDAYVRKFGKEPTPTEIQFLTAQSWRESSGQWPNNNPGQISGSGWKFKYSSKDPAKLNERSWATYDSAADGADAYLQIISRNPNILTAAREGDVLGFMTGLAQVGYFEESIDRYYNNCRQGGGFPALLSEVASAVPEAGLGNGKGLPPRPPQTCAFQETAQQYQKRAKAAGILSGASAIARFQKTSPYGPECPLGGNEGPSDEYVTPDWEGKGAANAKEAKKSEDKTAGQDLNRTDLGKSLLEAQNKMAKLVQQKLEVMRNTPPLRMLVNPESFKVAAEKIVSDGNWTRHGPIIEHCCDNQDKITGSGKVAGFYSVDAQNATGPGLARTTRNYSMAYQNFLSLWLLYRNNGGLLVPDSMTASESDPIDVLSVMGSIYIYYDGILYIGSFDSFNVNETDTVPFTLEYDFQFTVRAWYELDRSDPAQYQYGVSGMFKQGGIPVTPDTQKTYEAAQAAGAARKKEAEALAAERNKLDSLYASPDQLYGGK